MHDLTTFIKPGLTYLAEGVGEKDWLVLLTCGQIVSSQDDSNTSRHCI